MREVKERKPVYIKDGIKIYNPGFVDCYQKPWYVRDGSGGIEYYGRFSREGYPDNISLDFSALQELINKIQIIDPVLKSEIITMIEEMKDANYAQRGHYIKNLPSGE
jgi:hypothetical protein